jgi:LysM repeat protein
MRRSGFAVLALMALVLPLSATAATVTVRSGETLTDIAYRSGVSVGTLIRLNNMSNGNYLRAGSQIQVPGPSVSAGKGRHRVKKGETLSRIASQYKVSSRDMMAINGLRNANHVEVGQNLKLPSDAVLPKPGFKPVAVTPIPGASEHTVAKGQTLTQIAKAYNLPISTLISINDLRNPNKVEVGTRLYLKQPTKVLATQSVPSKASPSQRKPATSKPVRTTVATTNTAKKVVSSATTAKTEMAKSADWRTYGPLQVNWANWQPMGGSQVVPTLNSQGQGLYLAVNCSAKKINATGADGSWKLWAAPQSRFEKALVKDRCQARA